MIHSDSELENDSVPFAFAEIEQDQIWEDNIDAFDDEMDNKYDDGIKDSVIDDHFDEEGYDEESEDEDDITPFAADDELDDYDELED